MPPFRLHGLKHLRFPNETPFSLIEKWESFILECEDGFDWGYSEYIHELQPRTQIEKLIELTDFKQSELFPLFFDKLALLDSKFKGLCMKQVELDAGNYWWERCVLEFAGEEYCYYMEAAHGIKVSEI